MLLLSLLLLLPLGHAVAQSLGCMQEYSLRPGQQLNISSTNYPGAYAAGSSCRFRLLAPANHVVRLSCGFEVYPDSCGTEFLFISRDGDLQFRDAERYCRISYLVRASNFQALAVGYYSSSAATQQRARLSCQATVVPVRCDCGWSYAMRIANGEEASKHEFPSMVALRNLDSSQRILCGGSIVSDRYIVTAAHCTAQQPVASRLRALVGEHDLSTASESIYAAQYAIQRIIQHPAYMTSSTAADLNDIALLQTTQPMIWSRGVSPICLPFTQSTDSFSYMNVDVVGWGTLGFAAAKSNTLQRVTLQTMDNRICQNQYNASIQANQLCTYDARGLGQDSCQYDSGGPVILRQRQRHYLLAVISYGRICGQPYGIGINTRITAHLSWLWSYLSGAACVR